MAFHTDPRRHLEEGMKCFWFERTPLPVIGDDGKILPNHDRVFDLDQILLRLDPPSDLQPTALVFTVPRYVAFGVFPYSASKDSLIVEEDPSTCPTLEDVLGSIEDWKHILTLADLLWILSRIEDRLLDPAMFLAPLKPIQRHEEAVIGPIYRVERVTFGEKKTWRVKIVDPNATMSSVDSPMTVMLATYSRPSL